MNKTKLSGAQGTNRRALILATGRYADRRLSSLSAPRIDAERLRAVLGDRERGGFRVASLVDRPVREWRQQLGMFVDGGSDDDLLLLYIAGHAVKDLDGELYFAAADTRLNRLPSTGITAGFIQQLTDSSRARRMILVFDTCTSGVFLRGYLRKADRETAHAVGMEDYFSTGAGRVVITASGEIQYALEGRSVEKVGEPPAFTRHVIDGLASGAADLGGDGQITTEELYRYVLNRMAEEREASGQGLVMSQRPQRWVFGLDGPDLVVAGNPQLRAAAPLAEQPEPKPVPPADGRPVLKARLWALAVTGLAALVVLAFASWSSTLSEQLAVLRRQVNNRTLPLATSEREIRLLPSRDGVMIKPAIVITGRAAQMLDFHIDETLSPYKTFRVTIDRVDQGRVQVIDGVQKDAQGRLRISLNSAALGPGNYQVAIEGVTAGGGTEPDSWVTIGIAPLY